MTQIYILLDDLKNLFNVDWVKNNKVPTIKLLRQVSGDGLRETKDFCEQVMIPALEGSPSKNSSSFVGSNLQLSEFEKSLEIDQKLNPPMFLIGQGYKQHDGSIVLIVGASNQGTFQETVYSIDEMGNTVHRYNRMDYGRVTGTSMDNPDPRNLKTLM